MDITPIIYRQFSANTYLVGTKGGPVIVIDPGLDSDSLAKTISENHAGVAAILLTHGHFDHIGGVDRLVKEFGCPVYIHEADAELFYNPRLNGSHSFRNDIEITASPITFGDDEVIELLGERIETIHTPFHTQGSSCFFFPGLNAIFTGDTLFRGAIGRTDLPGGSEKSIPASLAKLRKLAPSLLVYPGHDGATTIGRELQYNRYFR